MFANFQGSLISKLPYISDKSNHKLFFLSQTVVQPLVKSHMDETESRKEGTR